MKTINSKQKVIDLSRKITPHYTQIVIDLFQDDLEELLDEQNITPEDIGAFHYNVDILKDIFNPKFTIDIQLLTDLQEALKEWGNDREFVNKTLGLDPNE